ncbi:hypothetical protein Salat_2420100 [Sesamum alatum]|uniref:Uncharacterized protein n=1 Tax=Sesamum alatum TaxID=300844 RepID=A0AAE1XYR0_9LAMI|nr:hypothetical protein Salat_2420100 [Sesamum alatum]
MEQSLHFLESGILLSLSFHKWAPYLEVREGLESVEYQGAALILIISWIRCTWIVGFLRLVLPNIPVGSMVFQQLIDSLNILDHTLGWRGRRGSEGACLEKLGSAIGHIWGRGETNGRTFEGKKMREGRQSFRMRSEVEEEFRQRSGVPTQVAVPAQGGGRGGLR